MEKVYIVYQLGYNGSQELDILGVYNDYKKAEEKYLKEIDNNIRDYDYGYDFECQDVDRFIVGGKSRLTRLFKGGYQENWDNYLEIYIEEKEVE